HDNGGWHTVVTCSLVQHGLVFGPEGFAGIDAHRLYETVEVGDPTAADARFRWRHQLDGRCVVLSLLQQGFDMLDRYVAGTGDLVGVSLDVGRELAIALQEAAGADDGLPRLDWRAGVDVIWRIDSGGCWGSAGCRRQGRRA